ncbi:hypothetical protein Q1695_004530 [Nippostrongylus brasiliensis]|nr:hypothetical protein Q1695_004530 [Nippostrongylus brasiliensis]
MNVVTFVVTSVVVCTSTITIISVHLAKKIAWNIKLKRDKRNKKEKKKTLEDPDKNYALPLIEKINVNHNTRRFRFGLPSKDHYLGCPPGQHVYLSAEVNGELVLRPYTPISSDDDLGYTELMVKIYPSGEDAKFPKGGKLSQYLDRLKIGDKINFRGPHGLIVYEGDGKLAIRSDESSAPKVHTFKHFSMIAGGTGITPMLQIITAIMKNPEDRTTISLLFANRTENDILHREELDKLDEKFPNRFERWYTVDRPPANWTFSSGFVDETMIKEHLAPPADDACILMCGPPAMISPALISDLRNMGYDSQEIFKF